MTEDDHLAQYLFSQVASSVFEKTDNFDLPTMEQIEEWVEAQAANRPAAREWLAQAWTSDLNDLRRGQHKRRLESRVRNAQAHEERQRNFKPHWDALASGTANVGVLLSVALAYEKRFSNVNGNTPAERVQDLLVSDRATAESAIAGIDLVLARNDLPSVDDILGLDAEGKYHLIRPAALLAASRCVEKAPDPALDWHDELAQKLVAFYLTEGAGKMPTWYRQLAAIWPEIVGSVLLRYVAAKLKRKGSNSIGALWQFRHEADQRLLARLVLPKLLEGFPLRASREGRSELTRSLLAGLHLLDDAEAAAIVNAKLAGVDLDALQRIAWLAAELPYRAEAAGDLADRVGTNKRRATVMALALHEQGILGRAVDRLAPVAIQRLIEALTPITPRERSGSSWSGQTDYRVATFRALLTALSSNPYPLAREALQAMLASDRLRDWQDVVKTSIGSQRSVAREAQFQAAGSVEVAGVIANLEPAHAADLQALVIDHLGDIEAGLRGVDTYLLRLFWEGAAPRDENFCRDLLLEKLRDRLLHLGVNVEREASAAGDKRADMRAEFMKAGRRIVVPIEVKKENHRHLWTAWQDQLDQKYTNDPAASGFGLYLVLWFGLEPRKTPEGSTPRNAIEMRDQMDRRIAAVDRRRLAVLVLDLSLPAVN
jgi:hypothetical protein